MWCPMLLIQTLGDRERPICRLLAGNYLARPRPMSQKTSWGDSGGEMTSLASTWHVAHTCICLCSPTHSHSRLRGCTVKHLPWILRSFPGDDGFIFVAARKVLFYKHTNGRIPLTSLPIDLKQRKLKKKKELALRKNKRVFSFFILEVSKLWTLAVSHCHRYSFMLPRRCPSSDI